MTTDDLIPPPPRVVLNVEEIVLSYYDSDLTIDQLKSFTRNFSNHFEDVDVTLKTQGQKRFTYRNGYERT